MNAKTTAILLTIVSLLLGGALWYRHSTAIEAEEKHLGTINQLSNQWKQATADLKDQRAVNLTLERDLADRSEALKAANNNLAATTANLAKTQADAKAAMEAAEAAMKARDEKIKGLEGERDDLTKQMSTLNGSIAKLEGLISETERKLKTSEGDREQLIKELKRLQAEKAELERRFQDLAVLREQVRKLRDELSIARRLDWIRRGVYGEVGKGAERLQRGFGAPATATPTNAATAAPKTGQFGLDVELRRDGGARANTNNPAAKPASTNAPAAPKPAAK